MKKTIAILIAALLALCFAACGEENSTEIVSPMNEVTSLEELSEQGNCAMIRPEGVELNDEAYFIIDGEPQIAEYQFTIDGIKGYLRCAGADVNTDISGLYDEDGTVFEGIEDETVYVENDELKAQRWFTVDGQYVFAVMDSGAMEWETFDAVANQFMDMEPVNWSSGVPFADYLALKGDYFDKSDKVYGAVNIKGDHAGLYVIMDAEDGSRLYWEMEAELKDGALVYEKETISKLVYDEEKGETVSTPMEDGGAGSVEVKDGALVFANACSEELKDLVLFPAEE